MNKAKKRTRTPRIPMPLVNVNAAGIDVGSTLMVAAVPPDRDEEPVRQFGAFTQDLEELAGWLERCCIDTVAMESTGVYWRSLYMVLIHHGIEVCLVNARTTRNVSGRKSDEGDAQWIQRLHACGLLSSSFLPDEPTTTLRTLVRHRRSLTQEGARYLLRMQKALELMNIKLHKVLNSLSGKTGMAITEAIVKGERCPEHLLSLVNYRVRATREELLKSLEGNYRAEHLFVLSQCLALYHFTQEQISACDQQMEGALKDMQALQARNSGPSTAPVLHPKAKNHNHPHFNTRAYLKSILQVDVMDIYGISETAALEILSETGTTLQQWPTANHFVAWLNLCPNNKLSGGKLIQSTVLKKKPNAAARAFRSAANALQRSDHWLGDYFRRMKSRGGNKYAIVATARKLAIIYYKMVRHQINFTPLDNQAYKSKCQRAKIAYLERKLAQLKEAVA